MAQGQKFRIASLAGRLFQRRRHARHDARRAFQFESLEPRQVMAAHTPTLGVQDAAGKEDTAIPLSISAALTNTSGSETLDVFVSGVPSSATLSNATSLGNGVWRVATGHIGSVSVTPQKNSDVDFTLTVTARATEAGSGDTADSTRDIRVTVDAVADKINFDTTSFHGFMNTKIPIPLYASLNDTDGSEVLTVTIAYVPVGATFWNGNTQVGQDLGGGVWQFDPSVLADLSILPPKDDDTNFGLVAYGRSTETANGDTYAAGIAYQITVNRPYSPSELIVLGSDGGAGSRPRVAVTLAKTGELIRAFDAYDKHFTGGVRVAVADLNNDGQAEIITAPGPGLTGDIRVFTQYGKELEQYRITAYEAGFKGGVFVAAADVDGDGFVDIVTSPDAGRAVEVRVWRNRLSNGDQFTNDVFADTPDRRFIAYGSGSTRGATVAAGDLTGDGRAEIVVGLGVGSKPSVRAFDLTKFSYSQASIGVSQVPKRLLDFQPFRPSDRGGVSVALGNVRGSDALEIVVGNGKRGQIQLFSADGTRFKTINAFSQSGHDAPVDVAVKGFSGPEAGGDVYDEIFAAEGAPNSTKHILVFEPDGALVKDWLLLEPSFVDGYYLA
jgi:hypothetical protein